MLYVLHGADTYRARRALHRVVDGLLAKKPDASYFLLTDETFSPAYLEEYIGGQGLFARRTIVVLDGVCQLKEAGEVVLEYVQDIADSENIFIVLEESLSKKELDTFTKHATKTESFEPKRAVKSNDFNVFALADALGNRDRGKLWTLYQQALRADIEVENIHGVLSWQVRTMVRVVNNDTEGLKPFAATKTKRFVGRYSEKEIRKLSSRLLALYHEAHRGMVDFSLELERLILSV